LNNEPQLDVRNTPNFKGYTPLLSSNNDPENAGDMHESFDFGWEELMPKENDEKRANDGAMAGANMWPTEFLGFREDVLTY
jgi:isopenicillin N synthase-like dioxygenase